MHWRKWCPNDPVMGMEWGKQPFRENSVTEHGAILLTQVGKGHRSGADADVYCSTTEKQVPWIGGLPMS